MFGLWKARIAGIDADFGFKNALAGLKNGPLPGRVCGISTSQVQAMLRGGRKQGAGAEEKGRSFVQMWRNWVAISVLRREPIWGTQRDFAVWYSRSSPEAFARSGAYHPGQRTVSITAPRPGRLI